MRIATCTLATLLFLTGIVRAAATEPSDANHASKIPAVHIDAAKKQIRVDCFALNADMPLEFFCVKTGGNEYESVLRTDAHPSDIHFGLLALGLTPGEPAHYLNVSNTWIAPTGAPLQISCELMLDGKLQTIPANRLVRSIKTRQEMPAQQWVFDGSRVLPDGQYAADITGYVVSLVNFDLTMIDVPNLASNSNETLLWEYNPAVCPKKGTPLVIIIEPAPAQAATRPAEQLPADQFNPGPGLHGGAATRP